MLVIEIVDDGNCDIKDCTEKSHHVTEYGCFCNDHAHYRCAIVLVAKLDEDIICTILNERKD